MPLITELQFVAPLEEEIIPELPDERNGRSFYRRLLYILDNITDRIAAYEENRRSAKIVVGQGGGQELDWLSYHFKNKIAETGDQIKTIALGFQDKFFTRAPAIPLRLKRGQFVQRRPLSRGERENLRDRLFQEEGLREISEAYQFASAQFDSIKSEFIDYYLETRFLQLFVRGFLHGKPETAVMRFRSLITALGGPEIDFLIDRYARLFAGMDLPHRVDRQNGRISVEGYGVHDLLSGETGIHLFYTAHRNPLPIYISLHAPEQMTGESSQRRILRIYDGTSALLDLRTGYSNAVNITANELKLLLFAGIDPRLRKEMKNE